MKSSLDGAIYAGLAQVVFGQTEAFNFWTWSERRAFNPEVRGSSPRVGRFVALSNYPGYSSR